MEIFLWGLGVVLGLAGIVVLAMITAVFIEGTESGLDDD